MLTSVLIAFAFISRTDKSNWVRTNAIIKSYMWQEDCVDC